MVTVVWSTRAVRDREDLHAYWARTAGAAAANAMLVRVTHTLDFIARYPTASIVADGDGSRNRPVPGIPEVIRYRFHPRAERVRIVRLYHARRERR